MYDGGIFTPTRRQQLRDQVLSVGIGLMELKVGLSPSQKNTFLFALMIDLHK